MTIIENVILIFFIENNVITRYIFLIVNPSFVIYDFYN